MPHEEGRNMDNTVVGRGGALFRIIVSSLSYNCVAANPFIFCQFRENGEDMMLCAFSFSISGYLELHEKEVRHHFRTRIRDSCE